MDFDAILEQAIEMLQRRGRLTYRTLKRQFQLDDEALEDLTFELIEGQRLATDENRTVLVWVGSSESVQLSPPTLSTQEPAALPTTEPEREPLSYTPAYLAEKILTAKSSLEGERKVVTVLFADIKDSTELIRDLDPEDAQKLLDPAIHIMMEAVHRFEGTVNQVLGDGVMSIFGAPIAHEDHAARACYAALAMQAAMHPYAEEVRRAHGIAMRIRVGLNSGEVVVRTIGNDLHMDYSAVGQTTNLASRMEQLAAPGSVVLTAATLRLVEGLVRVHNLGPVPVKGVSEPVEVYELTGASTVRRRLQAAVARGLTKFVGRDTEIDALNQALEQAGSGHGQIVAAVGEAGIGKSRLVYEFVHSHRTQGWLVLESASVSYSQATPYFPVIDLLKRYVHVEERDESRLIRAKVTGHILTLDESLQDTIPALLSLLDALPEDSPFLQLDPPQRRQRILDGLKRILLRESQVQPLVLVFEDLHWHDNETQALLDSLVESLSTAQLLLLVNYRPEYNHGWSNKTCYTQLRLDPLPPESADALLEALLGGDASLERLKTLLIERTEGNPFFLEESVRTLVETQVLAGKPGMYRLGQDLPTIQVPPTVQAVLAARIDRLPQEEKRLLQTAAVIGTEVPFSLLQPIVEIPDEALHPCLTHLQAAEFLYEASLFPERVYTFKHALTHEVAYGSLLQERRRVLHARIVATLESHHGDPLTEQVERLAHHAMQGEVWDKALLYFRQAGEKAEARSAYREAVACHERALDALQRLPERQQTRELAIDLRFKLRRALTPLGEFARGFAYLREAETLAEALDDPQRLGWVSAFMAFYFSLMGEQDRAITSSQRALAIAAAHDMVALQDEANTHLGQAYYTLGAYRHALNILRPSVARLEGDWLRERIRAGSLVSVFSRTVLVLCLAEVGAFHEGRTRGAEGVQIAEAANHSFSLILAYWGAGLLELSKGDLQLATPLLERGMALCQTANLPALFPIFVSASSYAYALAGRRTEALEVLDQAMAAIAALKETVLAFSALVNVWLGEACLLTGRIDDALSLALSAHDHSQKHQGRGHQAWVLRFLGDIAMHRGSSEVEQAHTHYQQALTLAIELGMRPLQAHCHRSLGTLYSQTRQIEQARAELSTAIELYRDMEMTFWIPETEAALAAVEGQ
jgi:class 3 adenylate cyclase/tetratricopeptide (TPR) repeat protein